MSWIIMFVSMLVFDILVIYSVGQLTDKNDDEQEAYMTDKEDDEL